MIFTRKPRKGVAAVWTVIALVSLLGIAALVIDIGQLTIAAQQLQNVLDAAALSGAHQLPNQAAAKSSLQGIVQANTLESPAWPVVVTPAEDVVFMGEGAVVEGHGTLEKDEAAIEVTGRIFVDYMFARIFGLETATVTRSATALLTGSGSSGAGLFFAGETNPIKNGIKFTGSNHHVDGTLHSNTKVDFVGSNHCIEGDVEYLNDCSIGSGHEVKGNIVESTIQPYPVDFTFEQYDVGPWDYVIHGDLRPDGDSLPPGRYRVHGDFKVGGSGFTCTDSLFVCDDDIRFTGSGHALDRVTLVSRGYVRFTGSMRRYSCFVDDLFAFALKSGVAALDISGSATNTEGILYAPNGELNFTGSGHVLHRGALIGNTIRISGSNGRYAGFGDGGAGGAEKSVRLIK